MAWRGAKWQLVAVVTVATCLVRGGGQRTRSSPPSPTTSARCSRATGNRAAKATVSTASGCTTANGPGIGPFELHLGPFREFALFPRHSGRPPGPQLCRQPSQALQPRSSGQLGSPELGRGRDAPRNRAGRGRPGAVRVLVRHPEADRDLRLPLTAEVIRPTFSAQPRRTDVLKSVSAVSRPPGPCRRFVKVPETLDFSAISR